MRKDEGSRAVRRRRAGLRANALWGRGSKLVTTLAIAIVAFAFVASTAVA